MNKDKEEETEKKQLLISFSGGRTSAFMTKFILESEIYKDYEKVVVFANTGKERLETLDFVNECDLKWNFNVRWIEAEFHEQWGKKNWYGNTDYKNASRNGEPFEAYIKKERLPNQKYPNCSGRLKSIPIHKFMRYEMKWKNYYTAIGIRSDETQRINWESANKNKFIYPLVTDLRVDTEFIRKFWLSQDFDLQLKDYEGNCDMCWKKSKRKLMTLVLENPKMMDWWKEMETKYGDGVYTFWRGGEFTDDIIEEAMNEDFNKAIDEYHEMELSDEEKCSYDIDLDAEASCFCKE